MATSSVTYASDGTTQIFSVPFLYVLKPHVRVYVNNALQDTPGSYVWNSDSSIRFNVAPIEGSAVYIRRVTPLDNRLVTFTDGASLTEADLNLNTNQVLYGVQEVIDALNAIMTGTYTDPSNELLANAASQVLTTEAALEVQARITDIDHAGQLLLDAMMQRRVLGEPNDDYSAFKLATGTITLDETGVTLLHKFATIETDTTLLAQDISLLGARNAGGTAFILDVDTVFVDAGATESMADRFSTIASDTASNLAAISTEASTRSSADTSLASLITALTTTVGTNTAAIATEASARASGDSANASSITALSSTVSGHTSSLTTLAATDVTLAGGITTLNARYGVALNVDGFVSGFTLNSSGGSGSSFDILTNKFRVVDPGPGGAATPVSVFTIESGNVLLRNLYLDHLILGASGAISSGKTTATSTTNGLWLGTDGAGGYDLHVGDASSYMRWDGSASTLIINGDVRIGRVKTKASSTSRNTTTTYANDPDLVLTNVAVGSYKITLGISGYSVNSGGAPKIQLAFTGSSSGALGGGSIFHEAMAAVLPLGPNSNLSVFSSGSMGHGAFGAGYLKYELTLDVTSVGDLSVQWAQQSSDGSNTTIGAGSTLVLQRIL